MRSIHLIGEAAPSLAAALGGLDPYTDGELATAVAHAARLASPGDVVLLSPANASFDQFENFEHRGDAFRALARGSRLVPGT